MDQEPLQNLFFLSGPHGSGKTTFARELAKYNPAIMVPELYSRNIKFDTEPEFRKYLKLCGRAIENFEYTRIAAMNPDSMVLANRCIYDVLVYNEVHKDRGWVSEEVFQKVNSYAPDFFSTGSPYALVINPGFDVVRRHLAGRWQKEGKKWREDDMEYMHLICKAYERFQGRKNIFYIDHEAGLEDKVELEKAYGWMAKIHGMGNPRKESRKPDPVPHPYQIGLLQG